MVVAFNRVKTDFKTGFSKDENKEVDRYWILVLVVLSDFGLVGFLRTGYD